MNRVTMSLASGVGAVSAVLGALSNDEIVTWAGVAIAVGSAAGSVLLSGYAKLRDSIRTADHLDRQAVIQDIQALTRVQTELEDRITKAEINLEACEAEIEKCRCRYPLPDGAARCSDPKTRPPDCQLTPNGP